jgi:hypothetical protein
MEIIVGFFIVLGIVLYVVQWIRVIWWDIDFCNTPRRVKENNYLLKELLRQQKDTPAQPQSKQPTPWFKDLDFWNQ